MQKDKQRQQNLQEMNKVCLYGASGHGKVIRDIALSNKTEVVCFFDDNSAIKEIQDKKVLETSEITNFINYLFVISIGNNQIRKNIAKKLKVSYATLIHNKAVISSFSKINEGTVVMANAVVNVGALVGKHTIINTGSVVEHDCKLNDFVHISPNAIVAGGVEIGEGTHIGANATVIPNIKIGKWAIIGAGAVIIKDVPDYAMVVGNPGRIIKTLKK